MPRWSPEILLLSIIFEQTLYNLPDVAGFVQDDFQLLNSAYVVAFFSVFRGVI